MLKNIYIYNVQAFQETYNTFKQVYLKKRLGITSSLLMI